MMPLRIVLSSAVVAAVLAVGSSVARADLPDDVRTAADAEPHRKLIQEYVDGTVAKLKTNDAKSGAARDELARQCDPRNQGIAPSSSFQIVYITVLSRNLDDLLKSEDVSQRLNAGIIAQKVALASKQMGLARTVEQLMKDPSPAVALWGVKAAGALMPTAMGANILIQRENLTSGIVACVEANPNVGAIAQEAYKALDLTNPPPGTPALPKDGVNKLTDAINKILASRVKQYVNGIPADPQADKHPTLVLTKRLVTDAAGAQQKAAIVQNLVDLYAVTAQRFAETPAPMRDRLKSVATSSASGLAVMFQSNSAIVAAVKPLGDPTKYSQLPAAVTLIKQVPEHKDLRDPPTVKPTVQSANGNGAGTGG